MNSLSVRIEPVRSRRAFRRFVKFPYRHYRSSPYWIPPLRQDEYGTLDRKKNPAFEYCEAEYFLALRGREVVGRIAAILNHRYVESWGNRYVRFGFVEYVDDAAVSGALFAAAEQWARERDCTAIHGPLGFTDLDDEGMLTEGFEELGTLPMLYNYSYYPQHVEAIGFAKDIDWIEYRIKIPDRVPERIKRVERIVTKRLDVHLLDAKRSKDFLPYVPQIFEVINATYAPLYGVVELSDKQIEAYTKQYFTYIDPKYTKLVLDSHDRVIALVISMPSLSKALQKSRGRLFPFGFVYLLHALKTPTEIDLYLGAILPEYQRSGISALLMSSLAQSCIENGVTHAESSGNLENNTKVQDLWKYFEHRQHKRRRIYIKEIQSSRAEASRSEIRVSAL